MIQNTSVLIEPPKKTKFIIQCTRSQYYRHSKSTVADLISMLNVRKHNLLIVKDIVPKICRLCGGNHPTNYIGCNYYYNLTKNHPWKGIIVQLNQQLSTKNYYTKSNTPLIAPVNYRTYAHVNRVNTVNENSFRPRSTYSI